MRDIAQEAGMSLGAAYHYFSSKEELLLAYYEWMQAEHERLVAAASAPGQDLAARLRSALRVKLDLLRGDRKLLLSLLRDLALPDSPRSVFSARTRALRQRSIAEFTALCQDLPLPPEMRAALGKGLWFAHLGLFLHFVCDGSPKQARTDQLVELLADLVTLLPPLLATPQAEPLLARLRELLAGRGSET